MTNPTLISEAQQIEDSFTSLALRDSKDDLANSIRRPGFGTQGKKIEVMANMFPVTMTSASMIVYHYDININPHVKSNKTRELSKDLTWKIWKKLCASAPSKVEKGLKAAAYDREHSFYTPHKLELSKAEVTIPIILEDDITSPGQISHSRRFDVKVQLAREIDLSKIINYCQGSQCDADSRDIVATGKAAINVLLRQDLYDRFVPKGGQGRRFFTQDGATPMSGAGLVLNGFMQSLLTCQSGKPAIQLDTAYGPFFRSGPLLGIIMEILEETGGPRGGRGRGSDRGGRGGSGGGRGRGGQSGGSGQSSVEQLAWQKLGKLTRLLWGAKYTLSYGPSYRPRKIDGFTDKGADQYLIKVAGLNGQVDQMIPVVQYYKVQYNITLKHPRLPMITTIMMKDGKRTPRTYPIELVNITDFNGIPFMQVSADQTAEMIKIAAKVPADRMRAINKWRAKLDYSQLPKLKEWCLSVDQQMMKIPARVLDPPKVQYKGRTVMPSNGSWNLNDNRVTNTPLKSWSVICFDHHVQEDEFKHIVTPLIGGLKKNGCMVSNERPPLLRGRLDGLGPALQKAAEAASTAAGNKVYPQLIVIIVSRKETGLYQEIKRTATNELTKPVVTQLMLTAKFRNERGLRTYLGNVAMKIHSKLGGVTHTVAIPHSIDRTTMIVGADVTHPPPANKDKPLLPSISVSVAAVNGENSMFVPCIRLQKGRKEMIEDLSNMMKDHITRFEKKTGNKPQKILFFRDGVSEGQYDLCTTIELDKIKQAFRDLDKNYKPKVTFIICAKRHHMRFFATSDRDADKTGNLLAGTCVDTAVAHPYAFDFYLQAHAGLQGTARPTHYVVVADENAFTADRMQNLCNSLCYSYARSSRAVSLIPVTYLIAFKARDFCYPEDSSDGGSVAGASAASGPVDAVFDPKQLYKRLEQVPQFNEVMWVSDGS
ncbi:uncharacterized protein IL334_001702 [Kwoniella shivajii]|uniref:Piwi domain-containing protein n=1 Tax=Kwoniella shivajii TaxID=564305 RepID=A0ABZ1CTB0_9TREE|nr:hypothetical protein IL334_001702 [Kwoniella shivajii]